MQYVTDIPRPAPLIPRQQHTAMAQHVHTCRVIDLKANPKCLFQQDVTANRAPACKTEVYSERSNGSSCDTLGLLLGLEMLLPSLGL